LLGGCKSVSIRVGIASPETVAATLEKLKADVAALYAKNK